MSAPGPLVVTADPAAAPVVIVVNVDQLFAEILRLALTEGGRCEVADCGPLAGAVSIAARSHPDVVILGLGSRRQEAIATLQALRTSVPASPVLVLAPDADAETLSSVMTAGAKGCLTVDADLADFVAAVLEVARGEMVLSGHSLEVLVRHLGRQETGPVGSPAKLTDRELIVLTLLVRGATTDAITAELGVSPHTTRTHIQNVLSKLGVHSRLEAAAYAAEHSLV